MPPEQTPQPEKNRDELRPLRTFQSDVEEVMKRRQVSKATIAIAESERQATLEEKETQVAAPPPPVVSKVFHIAQGLPTVSTWNVARAAPVALVLLFLVGAGFGISFFWNGGEPFEFREPIISVATSTAVTLGERDGRTGSIKTIQSRIDALSVPQNALHTIPVMLAAAPITTAELLGKLETAAPGPLVRALGASPILGVHGWKGGQPFFLWSVSSYDHAFSGMLSWEPDMLDDIGPLFGLIPREITAQVSSTTAEIREDALAFKDVIVRNKDARAVFGPKGTIIFLYSFIDKETLVVTTNEETLKFLMSRAGGGRLK